MRARAILVCGVLGALGSAAGGELRESGEHGFVSVHELHVKAPPGRLFEALTAEVSRWWHPAHTYSGDAGNLSLDRLCGLCEVFPAEAADGAGRPESSGADRENLVRHMGVDLWRVGRTLRLRGGLGPLQTLAVAGSMTFDLEAVAGGTRLVYRYTVRGTGTADWAGPVDQVQREQLERLRDYVETGAPVAADESEATD